MKTGGLLASFYVSLLLHGAVLGTVFMASLRQENTGVAGQPPCLTLEIISPPDKSVSSAPEQPAVPVAPPPKGQPSTRLPAAAPPPPPAPRGAVPRPATPPELVHESLSVSEANPPQSDTQQPETISSSPSPKLESLAQPEGCPTGPAGNGSGAPGSPASRVGPAYRTNPGPFYPPAARRRGQEGTVLLGVRVAADGRAARVQVKQSSGFPLLDEAAVKAVSAWGFEPARVDAQGVASDIEVPVCFKLR